MTATIGGWELILGVSLIHQYLLILTEYGVFAVTLICKPISAHDAVLELERKKLDSVRLRGQGSHDKSRERQPEKYCSGKTTLSMVFPMIDAIFLDHYFADNLAGISNSSLLTALNSLVQNLFTGSLRMGVNVSRRISNQAKAAALSEAGCVTGKISLTNGPKDVRTLYELFGLNP